MILFSIRYEMSMKINYELSYKKTINIFKELQKNTDYGLEPQQSFIKTGDKKKPSTNI